MKNLILIFFVFIFYCPSINSQVEGPMKNTTNTFHVDIGAGYLFGANINYEKRLTASTSNTFQLSGRLGIGYIFVPDVLCDGDAGTYGMTAFNPDYALDYLLRSKTPANSSTSCNFPSHRNVDYDCEAKLQWST